MYSGKTKGDEGKAPTNNFYEGGIPDGGKNLFPKVSGEGEEELSYGGELGIKTSEGGPAVNSGSNTKDFLDDASYGTGDMSTDNEPKMKIVNPDDLHSS